MTIHSFRGKQPLLAERVLVSPQSSIIGDVRLGADVSVWPGAVVRGDMHWIRVGERTSIQDGAVLHITHASDYNPEGFPLSIGKDVTIGHNACLHGCTIGDEVLIGIGAIVLDGATVERQVLIAAGALVAPGKRLESGFLYRGNPAKAARELTAAEKNYFRYSANNYVKLKNDYLAAGFGDRPQSVS